MTRPSFCPECGKPLQADLIFPFSVGPKDYADGGYTVICRSDEGFCWQGDIYPVDEQRGRYSEEERREHFKAAVDRAAGRLDKLMDTMAMYLIEYHDRVDAHLSAISRVRCQGLRCAAQGRTCMTTKTRLTSATGMTTDHLDDAKAWVQSKLRTGVVCPACGQFDLQRSKIWLQKDHRVHESDEMLNVACGQKIE